MNRDTRIVAFCLAAVGLMIVGSSFLTTIAIARGAPQFLRYPFKLLCHGIAHRCVVVEGTAMPICARCLGIYSGFLAGLIIFPLVAKVTRSYTRLLSASSYLLAASAAGVAIDGFTQLAGLRESTNPLRLATGLMAGAAFGLWILVSVETRARQRLAAS